MDLYKAFESEIKDVDSSAGVVDIYVNAFGNEDSDGDISQKGAFSKTVTENFSRIRHFLNHDKNILLGIPLALKEDDFGLRVQSKMNRDKEIVRDVLSDYKLYKENNRTLEHSIGYKVIRRDEKNAKVITEYKLGEYSTLTAWGANPNTPLMGIKSKDDFLQKMQLLVQQYNAHYSDKRLAAIESELITLSNAAPLLSTHLAEPNNPEILEALKSFRQSLTI